MDNTTLNIDTNPNGMELEEQYTGSITQLQDGLARIK